MGGGGGGTRDLLGRGARGGDRAHLALGPWATSPRAREISSTARPASAEEEATSSEAPATLVAERDIWVTAVRSLGHEAGEGGAEAVVLRARLHVDGEVAGGHAVGGAGQRAQVLDHGGEGARGAPDLVAAADGELVVDVAVGKRLGGRRDGAQAPAEVARDGDGEAERGEQGQHADDDARAPGRALERDETRGQPGYGRARPAVMYRSIEVITLSAAASA